MLSPKQMIDEGNVMIGNSAGWHLAFYEEKDGAIEDKPVMHFGSDDYYATIQASLPGGLEGGVYSITLEGLLDEHYKVFKENKNASVIKLYMFWKDVNSTVTGYLLNATGIGSLFDDFIEEDMKDALVAVLQINKISRKAGTRRYETTITAREWTFDKLRKVKIYNNDNIKEQLKAVKELALVDGISKLLELFKIPFVSEAFQNAKAKVDTLEEGSTLVEILNEIGKRLEAESENYGRGMYLIRDGKLIVGNRKFPVQGDIKPISEDNGLIEVIDEKKNTPDDNFDYTSGNNDEPIKRNTFKLILKGRPDLKPGDVIEFSPPPDELEEVITGSNNSLGSTTSSETVSLYIASVDHKIGRTCGFSTTISGIEIDINNPWEKRTRLHRESSSPSNGDIKTTAEGKTTSVLSRKITETIDRKRFPEIGEIRETISKTQNETATSQTSKIWKGLEPGHGESHECRKLDIKRPSPEEMEAISYATPFAWGKCGLVLPRYPGTRVVVLHRHGKSNDPIDVGALWESGQGPDSEPGDWWLILPVGIDEQKRASLPDDDLNNPEEPTGQATQDLIDADGNRIIEVGEFSIRIGRDTLKNAGERPSRAAEQDSFTIEHTKGESSIIMKADGTVSIKAKNIELDAGSGEITMKASSVNVE